MRRSLVIGNWKMNGSVQQMKSLIKDLSEVNLSSDVDVVVCPVSVYLSAAKVLLPKNIMLGAQNVAAFSDGAYTGEVSSTMLADVGVAYCIIGHSERRDYFSESNENVAEKVLKCLASELVPVVCVGELLEQRQSEQTLAVIAEQVDAVLSTVSDEQLDKLVFAYEPVWAIGTGLTASPEQAQEVHAFIRQKISDKSVDAAQRVQILYGGSVKADNADLLFSQSDIDGGLIGGASLVAESFAAIVNSAN